MDPITIDVPSKYSGDSSSTGDSSPSLDWLTGTWTVTHSTLSMWRSARNVRITYTVMPAKTPGGPARLDDLVEYEPASSKSSSSSSSSSSASSSNGSKSASNGKSSSGKSSSKKTSSGPLKTVEGIDTSDSKGGWDWRGKSWLFFVGSHWEVLAWGEATTTNDQGDDVTERWAVTWFAPTVFTKEGIDVYCDRREGLSDSTYAAILDALKKVGVKELVDMVDKDMRAVEIRLPWATGK